MSHCEDDAVSIIVSCYCSEWLNIQLLCSCNQSIRFEITNLQLLFLFSPLRVSDKLAADTESRLCINEDPRSNLGGVTFNFTTYFMYFTFFKCISRQRVISILDFLFNFIHNWDFGVFCHINVTNYNFKCER